MVQDLLLVNSPFSIHPVDGDKIGERLALADEAGIEPALTMYSRPAFAIVSNKGPTRIA
jgi:hypothetical protein